MFYDWETKNRSFVKVANFLKELGVANYRFPLILYDPGLSGVDPFDPRISEDMQARVIYEASRNKFYYLRELVRIREQGAESAAEYEAHVGNMSVHFLRQLDINSYTELPRQTGKTITAAAEFSHVFLFEINSDMGVYNYNNEMVKVNISRIYSILNELPAYMHFHKLDVKVDPKNPDAPPTYKIVPVSQTKKLSASMKLRNNNITGKTPGINASQADEAGRGATMLHQWWDEPCATHNFDIAASAAFPAYVTASEKAKLNGAPHSIMITSTPPDIDSKHGSYLLIFVKQDMAKWNLSYFDKNKQQLLTILKRSSKNGFFFISFQYQQVFKSDEWYTKQLELIEPHKVRREILLQWEKEIVGNPFDKNDLEILDRTVSAMGNSRPLEMDDGLVFNIFCNSNPNGPGSYKEIMEYIYTHRVLIASDVSGGMGGKRDYSTLVGLDPVTSDLLFTFRSNILDPNEFAKLIHKFITRHCPKGVLAMERNNIGRGVLSNLRDPDPSKGIPDNLLYMPMSASMKSEGIKGDRGDTIAGIYTLQPFREVLFTSVLSTRIKKHKYLFRSEEILNEVYTLVEKNGRIDHKSGAHDDLLFAFMIGHWVLTDHYAHLLVDYPDMGARKIYTDTSLDDILSAKEEDTSMENLYGAIKDFRKYYEDIVDDSKDVINMKHSKQGMFTIDELINAQDIIRNKNEGKLPENRFASHLSEPNTNVLDGKFLLQQAERLNDQNKRDKAKELGMSESEYRYIMEARNNPQQLEYDERGLPFIKNDSRGAHAPEVKNRLMNIFGNRR